MELLEDIDYYILQAPAHSLWCSKIDGSIRAMNADDVAKANNPICHGIVHGLIGKMKCCNDSYWCLLLIKKFQRIGRMPANSFNIYRISQIVVVRLIKSSEVSNLQTCDFDLEQCYKHKNSQNLSKMSLPLKQMQKTWKQFKSATENIKPKKIPFKIPFSENINIPNEKEFKEKDKFERRIIEELESMFADSASFYFSPDGGDVTSSIQRIKKYHYSPTTITHSTLCPFFKNQPNDKQIISKIDHNGISNNGKPSSSEIFNNKDDRKMGPNYSKEICHCKMGLWRSCDDRFFWNKYLLKDIIDMADSGAFEYNFWIIPIVQGYFQIEECPINLNEEDDIGSSPELYDSLKMRLSIISRRSRMRAGTRYKRRGVNEEGHVANYVETEQVVEFSNHAVSFVQVRGSVPLFWSQTGLQYKPPPKIDADYETNHSALVKHLQDEIERYKKISIVSLVELNGKERVISEEYLNHIVALNEPNIDYISFDFHEYCRGLQFENIGILTQNIIDIIQSMKYCWVDESGIICEQRGVFRVNCIDCLDRTNIVQSAIARLVLEIQCRKLGLLSPEHKLAGLFRNVYQQMWANNGDVISKQYAGTAALKGDYTRTGERRFAGLMKDGVNSANRYFINRIRDVYRQAAIDLMLGNPIDEYLDSTNWYSETRSKMGEESSLIKSDHVQNVIDDCKRLLMPENCLFSWPLSNYQIIIDSVCDNKLDDQNFDNSMSLDVAHNSTNNLKLQNLKAKVSKPLKENEKNIEQKDIKSNIFTRILNRNNSKGQLVNNEKKVSIFKDEKVLSKIQNDIKAPLNEQISSSFTKETEDLIILDLDKISSPDIYKNHSNKNSPVSNKKLIPDSLSLRSNSMDKLFIPLISKSQSNVSIKKDLEMDVILLVSADNCIIANYDDDRDCVFSYQTLELEQLSHIILGNMVLEGTHIVPCLRLFYWNLKNSLMNKNQKRSSTTSHDLLLNFDEELNNSEAKTMIDTYQKDLEHSTSSFVHEVNEKNFKLDNYNQYFYTFSSVGVRVYNKNIVSVQTSEEAREYLKTISESLVTMCALKNLKLNIILNELDNNLKSEPHNNVIDIFSEAQKQIYLQMPNAPNISAIVTPCSENEFSFQKLMNRTSEKSKNKIGASETSLNFIGISCRNSDLKSENNKSSKKKVNLEFTHLQKEAHIYELVIQSSGILLLTSKSQHEYAKIYLMKDFVQNNSLKCDSINENQNLNAALESDKKEKLKVDEKTNSLDMKILSDKTNLLDANDKLKSDFISFTAIKVPEIIINIDQSGLAPNCSSTRQSSNLKPCLSDGALAYNDDLDSLDFPSGGESALSKFKRRIADFASISSGGSVNTRQKRLEEIANLNVKKSQLRFKGLKTRIILL